MQHLLSHFALDFTFVDLLSTPGILLSGSAALSLYLTEHNSSSALPFVPNDIDLYVTVQPHRSLISLLHQPLMQSLYQYLVAHRYDLDHSDESKDHTENGRYAQEGVVCVLTFVHRGAYGGQRIQLIGVPHLDLVDYLKSTSDLSCCMTWWDHVTQQCHTAFPEHLAGRRRIMRSMNSLDMSHPDHMFRMHMRQERIQKYKDRGFTVAEEDPRCIGQLDPRTDDLLGALDGCRAYDVIGLEEVDAAEWLYTSPWNLLIRVSDAFHAFDRRALHRCLSSSIVQNVPGYGVLCDTPHHQTIPEEILDLLLYGDWSVYELEYDRTVEFDYGRIQKSLYHVHCCTLQQYLQGEKGFTVLPEPRENSSHGSSDDDMPPLEPPDLE